MRAAVETHSVPSKVPDPELAEWIAHENGELRELLVDVRLPRRTVTLADVPDGRFRFRGIEEAASATGRQETLRRLRLELEPLLDVPPVILEAAGALAVRATSRQVRRFVDHPLIKTVRPNRRLRPRS